MGGTLTQPCWPAYVEAKPGNTASRYGYNYRREALMLELVRGAVFMQQVCHTEERRCRAKAQHPRQPGPPWSALA